MSKRAVVIGGSAGGSKAVKYILDKLPENFAYPIITVLHRKEDSDSYLIDFLNNSSKLAVKEAELNEKVKPGNVYIAPAGYHLLIEKDETLSFSIDEHVSYARPSIDVLFESAASCYENELIGIVLTGANFDGANGIKKIKCYGGFTIAQNPEEAEFEEMPLSSIKTNKIDMILKLDKIYEYLMTFQEKNID